MFELAVLTIAFVWLGALNVALSICIWDEM